MQRAETDKRAVGRCVLAGLALAIASMLTCHVLAQAAPPEADSATAGSSPKWVCDADSITLEPIWAGKPLEAKWLVRNKGEADLTIKLKKG